VADTLEALADHLVQAHARRQTFETLQLAGRGLSLDEAYAVQDRYVERLCAGSRAAVVGYKIGLTSQVMQRMCGIDSPIHGRILGSRVHADGCVLRRADYGRLGLEFEIAVKLARDVERVPATDDEMADYVEAICPAMEVVDDRAAKYEGLDAASLVADNSWNAGVILGTWAPPPRDLAARTGRLRIDGVHADEGRVGDALDHPFAPVRWLASELATAGRKLAAGMIVMTGSIVKTRFPDAAGLWAYEVDGLGKVTVRVD
jgi:2-keto-4-pentenoate hydratase